jgi:hypothetical protein
MLARDVGRLSSGSVRTLAWALARERPEPALAVLEGEPLARVGDPAVYRVRVHNPGSHPARLEIVLRGRSAEHRSADFEVRWDATLEPDAAADWWVRSRWQGDVELLPEHPAAVPARWLAYPAGRWSVAAHLRGPDGRERDRLEIGGTFSS